MVRRLPQTLLSSKLASARPTVEDHRRSIAARSKDMIPIEGHVLMEWLHDLEFLEPLMRFVLPSAVRATSLFGDVAVGTRPSDREAFLAAD